MTDDVRDVMELNHQPEARDPDAAWPEMHCVYDGSVWPCDARRLLDALTAAEDELHAALAALESIARELGEESPISSNAANALLIARAVLGRVEA